MRKHSVLPGAACVLLAGLVIGGFGCADEEEDLGYAPPNCDENWPSVGRLHVKLTIDQYHSRIPLTIFSGAIEENIVVRQDTVDVAETSFELPVDREYSVMARYLSGRDTILVVDSEELKVEEDHYVDAVCRYVRWAEADVRLHERTASCRDAIE